MVTCSLEAAKELGSRDWANRRQEGRARLMPRCLALYNCGTGKSNISSVFVIKVRLMEKTNNPVRFKVYSEKWFVFVMFPFRKPYGFSQAFANRTTLVTDYPFLLRKKEETPPPDTVKVLSWRKRIKKLTMASPSSIYHAKLKGSYTFATSCIQHEIHPVYI